MLSISRAISQVLTQVARSAPITVTQTPQRLSAFHTSHALDCQKSSNSEESATAEETIKANEGQRRELTAAEVKRLKNDRTQLVPVETSIKYLKSSAYQQTYGEHFVWEQYRRNHKCLFPPRKTRKTCIRKDAISTGNPCPICRDEYLVLDHRNIELLRQFISPQTGRVLSYSKTGLCQKRHLELMVAVERAMDYGLLSFDVPFREYDYSEYYQSNDNNNKTKTVA